MPRDPSTDRRRQTTLEERVKAIERHAQGKFYSQIAEELSISKSTVQNIIKAWENEQRIQPKPRPGRPKKETSAEPGEQSNLPEVQQRPDKHEDPEIPGCASRSSQPQQ
jgi:transposase